MSVGLRTERLHLRDWRPADLDAFAALNADPRVAEFLPAVLTREQSDALASRIALGFAQHGFGLWALEIPGIAPFAGFIGLSVPKALRHTSPRVWRLAGAWPWRIGGRATRQKAQRPC